MADADDHSDIEAIPLVAELELALVAARQQQALLRDSLTTLTGYLDEHPIG